MVTKLLLINPQGGARFVIDEGPLDVLNDCWDYNINKSTWQLIPTNSFTPTARWGHTASVVKNKMYVIGGSLPTFGVYTLNLGKKSLVV